MLEPIDSTNPESCSTTFRTSVPSFTGEWRCGHTSIPEFCNQACALWAAYCGGTPPEGANVIDGTINGIAMGFVPFMTRLAGRA